MVQTGKKSRIIFIDLMRAFAVIQMVQGHTIDVLLSADLRSEQFLSYSIWHFMRGMTAPIFMFSAGTTFTYLFRLVQEPFENNPRVMKGIKRFLLLLFLGYLLRYPSSWIFNFADISESQWRVFFAVDVLHLIGFGVLFLILFAYIAEKVKLNDYIIYLIAALLFILPASSFTNISWNSFLPGAIAGYFYTGSGSLFPLFPWAGYVMAGGILGSYLARNPMIFKTPKFSYSLALIGIALIILSFGSEKILNHNGIYISRTSDALITIFFRLGLVVLLNALVSYISISVETIPRIIILVGRNTLLIYFVHLIILYGSAWNYGLNYFWGKSLDAVSTLSMAVFMILIMTLMVYIVNKFKFRNKELVT